MHRRGGGHNVQSIRGRQRIDSLSGSEAVGWCTGDLERPGRCSQKVRCQESRSRRWESDDNICKGLAVARRGKCSGGRGGARGPSWVFPDAVVVTEGWQGLALSAQGGRGQGHH